MAAEAAAARAGCSTELVAGAAVAAAGVAPHSRDKLISSLRGGSMRPPLEPDLVCQLATLYQSSAAPTRPAFADSLLPDGSAHSELVKLAGQKEPLVRRMEAALGMPLLRLFTAAALKPGGRLRAWMHKNLPTKVRCRFADIGRAGQGNSRCRMQARTNVPHLAPCSPQSWWSAQHSLHLLPPCGPICPRLPQEGEVAAAARSSKQEGSAVAIGKRRRQQGSEQLDPNAGAVAVQGPEPKSPLGRGKRHRRPTAKAAATSGCEE